MTSGLKSSRQRHRQSERCPADSCRVQPVSCKKKCGGPKFVWFTSGSTGRAVTAHTSGGHNSVLHLVASKVQVQNVGFWARRLHGTKLRARSSTMQKICFGRAASCLLKQYHFFASLRHCAVGSPFDKNCHTRHTHTHRPSPPTHTHIHLHWCYSPWSLASLSASFHTHTRTHTQPHTHTLHTRTHAASPVPQLLPRWAAPPFPLLSPSLSPSLRRADADS